MSYYCTLAEAKIEAKASSTTDDDKMFAYIRQISARIDHLMNPRARRPFFEPYNEQRLFMVDTRNVNSWLNTFLFRQHLLAFSQVLLDTTDKTTVVEAFPQGVSPYQALRFTSTSHDWYEQIDSTRIPVYVKITGTWGFNSDYTNAWEKYDDLAAALTASGTTMTVADVDGDDPWGISPRFSPGALCRIGTEYIRIIGSIDTTANTALVRRGVNGSAAAAHSIGDDVEVWQTEHPIRRIVARQAGAFYGRRGAFEVQQLDGVGITQYPQDLLQELQATLTEYMNDY